MNLEPLTVLIVDDNAHVRALIAQILHALCIKHIVEAGDGTEAMAVLRARAIDIVMTDLSMQPTDGIAFVRELRNAPDSPNPLVPVIMVTGHSTLRRVGEARDAGVNEILSKPITARGVVERINRVIEHPRPFVRSADYYGPDRRRRDDPKYQGPYRRLADKPVVEIG